MSWQNESTAPRAIRESRMRPAGVAARANAIAIAYATEIRNADERNARNRLCQQQGLSDFLSLNCNH